MYCLSLLCGAYQKNCILFFFPIEIKHRQYVIVSALVIQHVYVTALLNCCQVFLPLFNIDVLLCSLPENVSFFR